MFTSLNPVSVQSEKPASRGDPLPMPELIRVMRGNSHRSLVTEIGPVSGRVVTADLVGSLSPGRMVKASAGSRRYLLPPPSLG